MIPFKRPAVLTKNDCYKLARLFWRQWAKRGTKNTTITFIDFSCSMRVNGYSSEDIQQVKHWVSAFASGRRYP